MVRAKDLNKVKKETERFRRQIKIAQHKLYRAWDIARTAPLDNNVHSILEQRERHYRSMKRRLAGMQSSLRAIQEGSPEPVKVEPWKVSRPDSESKILMFCEA